MIRKVFLSLIILCLNIASYSQDQIFLKDYKDTIFCKIIKDNVINILYKLAKNSDTTTYSIKGTDIEGYVLSKNNLTSEEQNKYGIQSNKLVFENSRKSIIKGVFITLNDFQENKPIIYDSILIERKKIFVIDSLNNLHEIPKNFFGGINGKSYFIWKNKHLWWLDVTGWFSVYIVNKVIIYSFYGLEMSREYKDIPYFLNTVTGISYKLNIRTVKNKILSQDSELLNNFLKEVNKKSVLTNYIKQYNERNKPPYIK